MTRLTKGAAVLALLFLLPTSTFFSAVPSRAACQPPSPFAYVYLEGEDYGSCNLSGGFLVVTVRIMVTCAPASRIRFSVPNPPVGSLLGESWDFPYTGDRINGMEINLGCHPAERTQLGSMQVLITGNVPCTTWKVDSNVEVKDCNGELQLAVAPFTRIGPCNEFCLLCHVQRPYDLFPPDGATDVPVNAVLSWQGEPRFFDPRDTELHCWVEIGTDPDCANAQRVNADCGTRSVTLPLLQPSTTYYWRAEFFRALGQVCDGSETRSEIQSFTTAGPLAVEASSWGKVKAMYRE